MLQSGGNEGSRLKAENLDSLATLSVADHSMGDALYVLRVRSGGTRAGSLEMIKKIGWEFWIKNGSRQRLQAERLDSKVDPRWGEWKWPCSPTLACFHWLYPCSVTCWFRVASRDLKKSAPLYSCIKPSDLIRQTLRHTDFRITFLASTEVQSTPIDASGNNNAAPVSSLLSIYAATLGLRLTPFVTSDQ